MRLPSWVFPTSSRQPAAHNLGRKHKGCAAGAVTAPAPVRCRLTSDCCVGDLLHLAGRATLRACTQVAAVRRGPQRPHPQLLEGTRFVGLTLESLIMRTAG